jgi:hypothetical protein
VSQSFAGQSHAKHLPRASFRQSCQWLSTQRRVSRVLAAGCSLYDRDDHGGQQGAHRGLEQAGDGGLDAGGDAAGCTGA